MSFDKAKEILVAYGLVFLSEVSGNNRYVSYANGG